MEQPQKDVDAIQRAMRKDYEKNRDKIIQYTIERNRLKAGDEKTKEQRRRWNKTYKEKKRLQRQQASLIENQISLSALD